MNTNDDIYKAKQHYQQPNVVAHYDEARFQTWHGRMAHQIETQALADAVHRYFQPNSTILDIPCGTGRMLDIFAKRNDNLVGVDISQEMLAVSKHRFQDNANFSFKEADAEALPFEDNTFAYLTSFRLMCHLPQIVRQNVLKEMVRVTSDILVINYHFDVFTPVMAFNKLFRRQYLSPYPLKEQHLRDELADINVKILDIKKLSWYERSSALVILQKSA